MFLFAAVGVLVVAGSARAQWSAPGNTAIADQRSDNIVVRNDAGSIALASGFVGSGQIRWPLTHVPGLDDVRGSSTSPYHLCLFVRVRDEGSTDRVVIRVRELTDGDVAARRVTSYTPPAARLIANGAAILSATTPAASEA